ncbi:MAG: DMT family transporter [Paludibacter sp.]|nr:DMT family transporter [Bacteroidales bacterium]MCM1069778.1 DMT family transporter [Prevotella sp.]MCM1354500.1 DMT family transporter [Bacteroides sp.]MCM1443303.1 DMT family transporter [Muribaculum sp.]MCM1482427.1 DMT family transporter [Paludibacter sp.]
MGNRIKAALPYLAILAAMLFWGSSGIATKMALATLPPLTLVTLRFLMAVSLMLVVGLLFGTLQRLQKKDIGLFLLAGFVQPFCYYILETYGLQLLSSPTVAEVVLSTGPLFAPLFAFLLLRERVTACNIAGILLSTLGVLLMILAGSDTFAIGKPFGFVLLFLAVFAAVFYTILLRKIPASYNSLTIVFYVQLCSLLFFIPVFCVVDLPHINDVVFSWNALGAVAYLAALSSVAAFVLFCYTVRCIGVTRANAFNNIRPVFTALMMLCFFDEHLPVLKWAGMLLVVVGLFLCQCKSRRISR